MTLSIHTSPAITYGPSAAVQANVTPAGQPPSAPQQQAGNRDVYLGSGGGKASIKLPTSIGKSLEGRSDVQKAEVHQQAVPPSDVHHAPANWGRPC